MNVLKNFQSKPIQERQGIKVERNLEPPPFVPPPLPDRMHGGGAPAGSGAEGKARSMMPADDDDAAAAAAAFMASIDLDGYSAPAPVGPAFPRLPPCAQTRASIPSHTAHRSNDSIVADARASSQGSQGRGAVAPATFRNAVPGNPEIVDRRLEMVKKRKRQLELEHAEEIKLVSPPPSPPLWILSAPAWLLTFRRFFLNLVPNAKNYGDQICTPQVEQEINPYTIRQYTLQPRHKRQPPSGCLPKRQPPHTHTHTHTYTHTHTHLHTLTYSRPTVCSNRTHSIAREYSLLCIVECVLLL